MATLNGGITSTAELIRVSGTLPPPGSYVTIDSEALRINGAARGANGRSFTRDYLAVDRGVAGTTKATHSNGATLTRYYPEAEGGGGGGGVTVTGSQGGSVSGATAIEAPGTVAEGVPGQAVITDVETFLATVPLTDAQIKGFGSGTAVEVVAAPGVGKVVVPYFGYLTIDPTATAYGGINGSATIQFAYVGSSDASTPLLGSSLTALLGLDGVVAWATFAIRLGANSVASGYDAWEGENLPLGITGWNGGDGDFTGGNAANSGIVKVLYFVMDLAS